MAEESTQYQTEKLKTWSRYEIRPSVFFPAAGIIVAFVLFGVIFVDAFASAFSAAQDFITTTLGWFYILAVTIFLVFVIFLAISPYGKIKLGPDDSTPDYSYLSWFSMLFSAGMGIGLLFFSVAEPISHFALQVPPDAGVEPETNAAAIAAMNVTFFHWGLHAWAIYIIVGMALCYFAYRRGLPLTVRSAFYPLLGERIRGPIGDAIDTLAIVGTLFGVATSLGLGVIQINAGMTFIADFETSQLIQLLLVIGITAIATISVVLGLDAGIRRLSIGNVILGGILLGFLLLVGPTIFILQGLVESTGYYLQNIVSTSMNTHLFTESDWQASWTLFYWGWWISWSPFVGMFIARISRGRTVREFVTGVLLVPTAVTFLVLSVFGHTAFNIQLFGAGGIVEAADEQIEFALFAMLENFPLAFVTSILAMIVIATFFITSSDSGSLVDDIHSSGGSLEPAWQTRVFWALAEGAVAGILLLFGGATGLEAFQQASIMTGIPLAILLLLMCYALYRALKVDLTESEAREEERQREVARQPAGVGGDGTSSSNEA